MINNYNKVSGQCWNPCTLPNWHLVILFYLYYELWSLCDTHSAHVLVGMQENTLVEHWVYVAEERILLLEVWFVHWSRTWMHPKISLSQHVWKNLLFVDEFLVGCRRESTLHEVVLEEVIVCWWYVSSGILDHFGLLCADRFFSLLAVTDHF